MTMRHKLPTMSQAQPRFGSRGYLYVLMAGLFVMVWFSYIRGGNGVLPSSPAKSINPQNELSVPEEKAGAGSSSSTTTTKPESELLAEEVGLEVYPSSKTPIPSLSPGPLLSPLSSSGSKGSAPGSYSGGSIGTGSSGSSTNNNNNNAGSSDTPAADRPLAVIIESDVVPNLVPLMLHFANVLGPAWGMILFTIQDRWVEPLSPAFQRFLADGRIEVRFLPTGTDLTSSAAVSQFLTSAWVWEQLQAAHRILLFQSDSILCAKSEARVEDYFEYDLVGAPINAVYGSGYNGGLSIRNPRLFLQVVRETDFLTSGQKFEDQFFYDELRKRGVQMASEDVAKTFSVETIYYETPLGYHQPQRWQAPNMAAIEEWCPEVKMLIGRRAE